MEGIFQRSIVAAIFALAIGWASAVRLRKEFEGSGKDGRRLYSSFSYYAALPLFLLIYAVAVLIALRETGPKTAAEHVSTFFSRSRSTI